MSKPRKTKAVGTALVVAVQEHSLTAAVKLAEQWAPPPTDELFALQEKMKKLEREINQLIQAADDRDELVAAIRKSFKVAL